MGLADRHYMRDEPHAFRRSATFYLLVALVAAFAMETVLCLTLGQRWVLEMLGLSLNGIQHEHRFWQFLTFQFLHDWPWPLHLLFNGLALYFFGRSVEETLGRGSFLRIYFFSGFAGGVLQIVAAFLLQRGDNIPVVGASAGVAGLLAAYAALFPTRDITFFFYFFPITLRASYFFWIFVAISAFGAVVPFSGIAHAAHLGGLLMGLAYIRWNSEAQRFLDWRPFQNRQRKRELVKAASIKTSSGRSSKLEIDDLTSEEFISREVDPILDKISAHGIQSLTERERKILEAARKKMVKR